MTDEQDEYLVYARVAEAVQECLREGRPPDVDALVAEHPGFEDHVRQLVPTLLLLEQFGLEEAARVESDPTEPPLLQALGDYRILRQIGRGGMGVVYEAEEISLGRQVALKVLPFAAVLDGQQLKRFKNEARAAARLHHNHIVPVYSVGSERGVHYYAMQFIEGQSLAEVVQDLKSLGAPSSSRSVSRTADRAESGSLVEIASSSSTHSPAYFRAVARLGVQAAEALEHAHSNGVVHRDIKPSNLLLDEESQLWVTDFGLARLEGSANLTTTGDLVGTLPYMSPEQAMGRGLIDHRTDLYSLGATLYELVALQRAVHGEDRQEILRKVSSEEPRSLRKINPALPSELETIVGKAMEKESASRYETAEDLAEDLRRFLDHRPIVARPPTLLERGAKWSRRHRPVVAAALAVLILMTVGLAIGASLIWREKEETSRAWAQADANYQAEQQQRVRAEHNFQRALEAVDRMLTEVGDRELADIPQMEPVRRRLLQDALEFYQGFLEQESDDPSIRSEVARAHLRVAGIQRLLGKAKESDAAFEEAEALLEELVSEFPSDAQILRNLAQLASSRAILWYEQGRLDEAIECDRIAVSRMRDVVVAFPGVAAWRSDLALFLGNLGVTLFESGRLVEAEKALSEAQEHFERVATGVADRTIRSRISATYGNLGLLLRNRGRLEEAEAAHQRGVDLKRGLIADLPQSATYRRGLALALHGLAKVRLDRGIAQEAWDGFDEATAILEELVDDFPRVPQYKSNLAATLGERADVEWTLGRREDSEESMNLYLARSEELHEDHPDNAEYRRRLANAVMSLGQLYLETGRLEDSEDPLREALEHLEAVEEDFSSLPQYWDDRANALTNLGVAMQRSGRLTEAETLYRESLDHRRVVVDLVPDMPRYRSVLAHGLRNVGLVLLDAAESEEAEEFLSEALVEYELLAEDHFDAPVYRAEVIGTSRCLASLYEKTGRLDECKATRESALGASEALLEEFPTDAWLRIDLVRSWNALAWTLAKDPGADPADVERAVELAREAVELVPEEGYLWSTLGVALYRSGQWQEALEAFERSMELRHGGDSSDRFFCAMSLWNLGDPRAAQRRYHEAIDWMDLHQRDNLELQSLRMETAALLGVGGTEEEDGPPR